MSYSTVSECLQTNFSQISLAYIPKRKGYVNVKSSTNYFHVKTKILADFKISISVPLSNDVWENVR